MSFTDLLVQADREAAAHEASGHVYRQQHDGSHEQSRYDAMLWRERYTTHGRCKCPKCERAWAKGDPGDVPGGTS